jgi:Carboxypeptidase regulatory-like domain/TonB dependent receptor
VKDSSGAVIPGAGVMLTNTDTSLTRMATSSEDGSYRFPALPVGHYRLDVMQEGFSALSRTGITLEVGQEATIDLILEVGSPAQVVTVAAEAPLVQTSSSTLGGVVNEQQVSDLPLNGRNLAGLTLLQAGVTQTTVIPATSIGSALTTGVTISNNGMPIHSNSYMLDGANTVGFFGLNNSSIIGTTMGVDGVKEYKVITNTPSAEYGLSMGSQTAVVSKGGTNQFHGDAFDYLRNDALDARNYFDALDKLNFNGFGTNKSLDYPGKRIPPFHRNNFGAAFGGPIRKDKTFFYAVYEGLRQTWGQTIATNTLPGNCFDAPTHVVTPASLSACSGVAVANINPSVLHVLSAPIIPGQAGLFPYPNANVDSSGNKLPGATFNYSFPYIQPTSENYGQIRLDENLSNSDTFFVRYTHDHAEQIANRAYAYQRDYESGAMQFATLSETHIFSPALLNTLRVSFSRNLVSGRSTTSPQITDPGTILQPGQDMGGFTPAGTVTGLGFIAADGRYVNNIYTYSDDLYWTKGKHAFKFGTLINNFHIPEDGHFNNRGTVAFTNLSNLAQGIYSQMTALGGTLSPSQARYWGQKTFGFYVQDDYRVVPRLTLNLGFRYEFGTIPTELRGNNWQIRDVATADGNSPTQGAVRSELWSSNPSLKAFSPRAGFAWDPSGNGKMAIRGAAGIYYDLGNLGAMLFNGACCQPPLDFFNTINNSFSSVAAMKAAGLPEFQIPLPTAYGSAPRTPSNPNGVLSTFTGLASPRNMSYHWAQPTDYQWNLTVERQFPGNQAVSAGYVGARGIHIVQLAEGNPTTILGFVNGRPYYCHPADNPTGPPTPADQCPTTAGFPRKSNPTYGIVNQNTAGSDTWYNALQVNWTKRFSRGVSGGIAYTWSKLLDFGSGQQGVEAAIGEAVLFPQVRSLDKGPGGFDITSNFKANITYRIPAFTRPGRIASTLNGWWIASIISMQSGLPINPLIGNRSLSNNPAAAGTANDRPDLDPSFDRHKVITHNPSRWFDPTMFDLPLAGTLGNAPRNFLRGPDLKNVDFAVNKDTRANFLGEQGLVQFRAEFFNIMNRPNFANPSSAAGSNNSIIASLSSPAAIQCGPNYAAKSCQFGSSPALMPNSTAGQIVSTVTTSRQIQLSLKFIF